MKTLNFPILPEQLFQSINPWRFYQERAQIGVVNIALGSTPAPEVEEDVLEEVGSYGRQLGRIGDALEILLRRLPLDGLSREEEDALMILRGQLAAVRSIKKRRRPEPR